MFAETSGAGGWGTCSSTPVLSLCIMGFLEGGLGLNVMGRFLLNRTLKEKWEGGVSG